MSISAEQINALIAGYTALKQYFEGARDGIDDRVNSLIPSVSGTLNKSIFVDPTNGDDSAPGTSADPVRSLVGASSLMSPSGQYNIYLMDDVVVDQRVVLRGHSITIASDELYTKRRLQWANQIDGVNEYSPCLYVGNLMSAVDFRDITFGNIAAAPHVTQKRMIEGRPLTIITSWICEFDTQAGDDLPFVFTNGQVGLWMLSATIPVEQSGLWLNGAAAGTDPATQSRILNTNLATL